ncbi:anhydro-N-acetylmuramic acid kinase [Synechococcus sp. RSCCF101]|nr:anhydro-N-acetylmuramic acid kinase [Synechococcus sp. RSCCF101]
MSGTSADGVDAVLAVFRGAPSRPRWQLLHRAELPYPRALRSALIELGQGAAMRAERILELADALTRVQAEAARRCDPGGQAVLVGCHGQTIWHRPPLGERGGLSWQLLQAPLLAHLLERPVVHDFRAADLALGGQGAPLVPATDLALLGRIGGWRALLNLGGIANLTVLPPRSGPERRAALTGWDCGPGNTLLDLAVNRFSDGRLSCDENGAWAARGTPCEPLIRRWLQEPYFASEPPKSTGRELFGSADLERRLRDLREAADAGVDQGRWEADALATLTAFTAAAVAADLERGTRPVELVVAGGGGRNATLMTQLRRRCLGMRLRTSSELGLDPQAREALAMALLAWWHQRRHPGSVISVTGASRPSVLGTRVEPPGAGCRGAVQGRGR